MSGARLSAALALLSAALGAACGGGSKLALYRPDAQTSRAELLKQRRALRAYDGAPPVIPHAVAKLGRRDCNACHAPGTPQNGERIGAPRSHPAWGDCRQCHVERRTTGLLSENRLEPLWYEASGSRLYRGAPPAIPHSIQNRENCAVCHIGAQAPAALRANHGPRPYCRQCHAANGQIDRR